MQNTEKDDADDDKSCVLEQRVVKDPGGQRGHIEDGVDQSRVSVGAERRHQQHRIVGICHADLPGFSHKLNRNIFPTAYQRWAVVSTLQINFGSKNI